MTARCPPFDHLPEFWQYPGMGRLRLGIAGLAALFAATGLSAAPALAVNSCVVTDAASLASVITEANGGHCPVITFQSGPTITLSSALPAITANVTIDGAGSPVITDINPAGAFSVTSGNVTFDDITVTGLSSDVDGGAINVDDGNSSDVVTVENSTFESDDEGAGYDGGAIANVGGGEVKVVDSTFTNDSASSGDGGAIYNGSGGTLNISGGSVFDDDSADDGGAIDNAGNGSVSMSGSTFEDDMATLSGGAIENAGSNSGLPELLVTNSIFVANAGATGGAIDDADAGGTAGMVVDGSEFTGNSATAGGAIYDASDTTAAAHVVASTFVGDGVGSASDGHAIDAVSTSIDVTSSLFVEDCSGTIASLGYNVAMPASSGGSTCAGAGPYDQVSSNAGDVAASTQNHQLTVPVGLNPAIDLIPDNTSIVFGGISASICPAADLLGDLSPDSSGRCDAGAIQVSAPTTTTTTAGGQGGGQGGGAPAGTGGSGATSTGTTTAPVPKKTITTTVKLDNQTITLVSPSMNVCTAPGRNLSTTLGSRAIKHSKKPRLRFRLATFTVGGKDPHTAKRVPARESIKLKGLRAHRTDRLRVVVRYRKPLKHRRSATVSKTITVKFKVC